VKRVSSREQRIAELAEMVGVVIPSEEASEIADRLFALVRELECLANLDLDAVEPVVLFLDEPERG
jgi:hypothetical protein